MEVPTPRSPSFARTNWIASFDHENYMIAREADSVKITSRETGASFYYPWANVAAYELIAPKAPSAAVSDALATAQAAAKKKAGPR